MPIGVWPQMGTVTRTKRLCSYVHTLACLSMIAIIAIPCLLYLFLEEKDFEIKFNTIGPLSHWIMNIINYCLLVMRGDDIRECVQHMEMDWRLIQKTEDHEVMLRYAKIGRFVSGFCAVSMQSGTLLFVITKSLTTTIIIIGNETVSMHSMACPTYSKFIDGRFSPANEIMLVVHVISCFIVNCVTAGALSLDAVFAMHASGQLNILFSCLNNLTDHYKDNKYTEQKLAIIVEHHLRVLRYIKFALYL